MAEAPVLFQTHIPPTVREAARAAVAGMQAEVNPSYSLRTFVADALTAHAKRLADDHNNGEPWPEVDNLPTGRRPTTDR